MTNKFIMTKTFSTYYIEWLEIIMNTKILNLKVSFAVNRYDFRSNYYDLFN